MSQTTHFGFEQVPEDSKAEKVREVFRSVAPSYDIMNDLMSGGLHRIWKHFTVNLAAVRPGHKVLDVASGSGDLAREFADQHLRPGGTFLVKLFQGIGFDQYLKDLRSRYEKVTMRKPKASRARSPEVYALATGFGLRKK